MTQTRDNTHPSIPSPVSTFSFSPNTSLSSELPQQPLLQQPTSSMCTSTNTTAIWNNIEQRFAPVVNESLTDKRARQTKHKRERDNQRRRERRATERSQRSIITQTSKCARTTVTEGHITATYIEPTMTSVSASNVNPVSTPCTTALSRLPSVSSSLTLLQGPIYHSQFVRKPIALYPHQRNVNSY